MVRIPPNLFSLFAISVIESLLPELFPAEEVSWECLRIRSNELLQGFCNRYLG